MLAYTDTPVQDISDHPLLRNSGIRVLLKREDLNHPEVSGNKWWKLKYNIEAALREGHKRVITFGGAYSNHIYATAAAANLAKLESVGIIRGEETLPLNPTLTFAKGKGMSIAYLDRQSYRLKNDPSFIRDLRNKWGDFYLIPEGGTNDQAVRGCEEFGQLLNAFPAEYICLPAGTGGTMAGVIRGVSSGKTVIGFAVLEQAHYLVDQVQQLVGHSDKRWQLVTDYAYGGYARRSEVVSNMITSFRAYRDIPLDFVYTGKMMCGVFDLITKNYFEKGKTVLVIHTGGLQGHSEEIHP